MSIESAKAFIQKVKTDTDFAQILNKAKSGDERFAIVKNAGFDCTIVEIDQAYSESPLTEKELESVAGGVKLTSGDGSCPDCWFW